MKWILFCGVLVCVARVAEFGALHKSDTNTKTDITTTHEEPETLPKHECRPGTEWTSQCNECHCTKRGRKRCTENICDKEQQEEERHCAALTSWRNDCNSCFCTENGQPSCTEKACKDFALEPAPAASNALPRGKDCAAGTKWKSQCNDCACTENGLSICTEKACVGHETDRVLTCAPESSWINDCNTCWCMDGRALCTKIGCHAPIHDLSFNDDEKKPLGNKEKEADSEYIFHNIVKREACTPKSIVQKDCNICKCSEDGQTFHCTESECMGAVDRDVEVFMESGYGGKDHIERHTVCEPRTAFQIRCNDCVCNHDGTGYTCNDTPCPVPEDVELFHELRTTEKLKSSPAVIEAKSLVCNPNRMFVRNCNTCWCNENGTSFFCTRKVCIPDLPAEPDVQHKLEDLRVVKQQCRPDEVFELDCNMCRCNPDGLSYSCTRRACFSDASDTVDYQNQNASVTRKTRAAPAQAKETPKACTPGQEFRMDCNTCLCDNEGQDFSCTRIDCNNNNNPSRRRRDVTNQDIDQCTPGSVFERECNVCRCDDDGHHAKCTTHRCEKPSEANQEDNNADTNFRCNAGEKFKRDCNDCTCSADGKSVFCTVNFCDKDIDNIKA